MTPGFIYWLEPQTEFLLQSALALSFRHCLVSLGPGPSNSLEYLAWAVLGVVYSVLQSDVKRTTVR